jgi:hypothetical protein
MQAKKGERRKVLPVLVGNGFTSNIATLLLRSPHTPASRQPRSWQDVLDNDRFRQLFPRRPPALTERAVQGLQVLDRGGGEMVATAHGSLSPSSNVCAGQRPTVASHGL